MFQSTHPRGVRLTFDPPDADPYQFQSTHPRGVRLPQLPGVDGQGEVSIHAPAWGATSSGAPRTATPQWFQSTHPRGVRHSCGSSLMLARLFQSTHPRGVRLYHRAAREHYVEFQSTHPRGVRLGAGRRFCDEAVSIHAPAWGATVAYMPTASAAGCFNPRTRVGCDLPSWRSSSRPTGFNPRTRVGCDPSRRARFLSPRLFQSTHPRGVRRALNLRS